MKKSLILLFVMCSVAVAQSPSVLLFGRTAAFNFNTVNGLALWLDAGRMTSANNPIQNGDRITGGTDRSDSNKLVQVEGSPAPLYVSTGGGGGSFPYLVLTNNGIGTASGLFTNKTFTVLAVVRFRSSQLPTLSGTYLWGGANSANPQVQYDIGLSSFGAMNDWQLNSLHIQNAAGFTTTNNSITHSIWYVSTFIFNGTNSSIRTNSVAMVEGGTVGDSAAPSGGVLFGGLSGSVVSYARVDFLRGMVWSRPLSGTELTNVEMQCKSDFGL